MIQLVPKPSNFCGIDVSAANLVIALVRGRGEVRHLTLDNTPAGHKTLVRVLRKSRRPVRVAAEATGNYHLDLALLLAQTERVQLMVVNPVAARRFAQAQMRRAKTDKVDAQDLMEFARRMPYEPWEPPGEAALQLRAVTRYLASLTKDQTSLKNRLVAASATTSTPAFVLIDLQEQIVSIGNRIVAAQAKAVDLAKADSTLAAALECIDSIPGFAENSSVRILGEFVVLDQSMTPDQLVAHAGLDPRPRQSGNRDARRKISKVGNRRLRGILYMPALTAANHDPAVQDWYTSLKNRGKPHHLAITAVMRRLLRVAWILVQRQTQWDTELFRPRQAQPDHPAQIQAVMP